MVPFVQMQTVAPLWDTIKSIDWRLIASCGGWFGAAVSGLGVWLVWRRYQNDQTKEAQRLEHEQWRRLYRLLTEISIHAAKAHSLSLAHSKPANLMMQMGMDVTSPYTQAAELLTLDIARLYSELTFIPQGAENLRITEFFSVKYPSIDQRVSVQFADGLQEIMTMVLARANGQPLVFLESWRPAVEAYAAKVSSMRL